MESEALDSEKKESVEKYRNIFVTKFVELFELKSTSYENVLQNNTEKAGTASSASGSIGAGIGGGLGLLLGAPGPGSTVGKKIFDFIGKRIGKKNHKRKAGKINEFVYNIKEDLRKILIQSGIDIFRSYEYQFIKINGINGGWSIGLTNVAQEAVDRVMNFIDGNDDELSSNNFITQGILCGKSKGYIKNICPTNSILFGTDECRIADLFEKVGVVIVDAKLTNKYYRKNNNERFTEKYGYRLLFDWETANLDEMMVNYTEEDCKTEIYTYSDVESVEILDTILNAINKKDPLIMPDRIEKEIRDGCDENKKSFIQVGHKQNEIFEKLCKVDQNVTMIHDVIVSSSKSEQNIHVWFQVISPVKSFTGRCNELENLHNALQSNHGKMVISQAATVSGLGGIGKSELARKYAETHRGFYNENVIWIHSETQESLKDSFQKLAKELKIPVVETVDLNHSQERHIIHIVKDVYCYFKSTVSLFIFDNVEEYNDIRQFLPVYSSPSDKKPYILITSRNCTWDLGEEGDIEVLQLNNFTNEEADLFIRKTLNIHEQGATYDQDIRELIETLHNFPLALQQAQAYILETHKEIQIKGGEAFGIKDYLNEYNKENRKPEFLNFSSKYGNNRYVKTVFTTWRITLETIKPQAHGKEALYIIEMMAYFASDRIFVEKLFSKLLEYDILWGAIELLRKYSIINVSRGLSNIHRLVQEVIRLELRNENREVQVLRCTLSLINSVVDIIEDDVTHFVSVWKHTIKYDQLINDFYFNSVYGKGNNSPLHLLAQSGEAKIIDDIIKKIKKRYSRKLPKIVNITDKYGRTPLFMAAEGNHLETLKVLKNHGADINMSSNIPYASVSTRKASGWTPLHVAAYNGFGHLVKYLMQNGAESNITDTLNRTAADLAINAGHSHVIEILSPGNYEYLLHIAVQHGRLDDVKTMYEKDIDINSKLANWTPLHLCSFGGHLEVARFLVEKGAKVDDPSDDGFTPLHAAASNGHLHVLKYLIGQVKTEICAIVNNDGWTLLHAAAQNGHLNVVQYLIESLNEDINLTDNKCTTPLETAAFHGKLAVVQYLLNEKANINAVNIIGMNILMSAAVNYHCEILKHLLLREEIVVYDISLKNKTLLSRLDFTILHFAAAYDAIEIVKVLVEKYKLDVNIGENSSLTPLHVAAFFNSSKVIDYLVENGGNINARIQLFNVLKTFNDVLKEGVIKESTIEMLVSGLFNFVKCFNFFCYILSTPYNIHRGMGYRANLKLDTKSKVNCSFIVKQIFSVTSIHKQINYVKSYIEEKKYKNAYSGTDAEYFLSTTKDEIHTDFVFKRDKLSIIILIILCVSIIVGYYSF